MGVDFRIGGGAEALAALDRRGLLAGAGESVDEYLARIRKLQHNVTRLETALAKEGHYEVEGMEVYSGDRIRPAFFEKANAECKRLFGFAADWVPAFFINPSFAFLFGGCSFSFLPDFFAMFIIRKSFKARERWLFYGRDELISHEMCHIARAPLESYVYEETFAYCTSKSAFRRLLGGIFLSQRDSFMLLGSAFALLLAQLCNLYMLPLPMPLFWALPPLAACWLLLRYWRIRRRLAKAADTLAGKYGDNARAVLFRCNDSEINMLAKGKLPDALDDLKTARGMILRQFVNGGLK